MRILLVGNLNVNPERFLPLVKTHNVWALLQSHSLWGASVRPPKRYAEIPTLSLDEIADKDIDIVWSLLSPWDGLDFTLAILERYPNIPVVRQSQGGITPLWHKGGWRKKKGGNYDFKKFRAVLEGSSGIMINASKYRDCLIAQGIDIEQTPFLLTNGMAFNADILTSPRCSRPDSWKDDVHLALIGRPVDFKFFQQVGFPLHCHSYQQSIIKTTSKKYPILRPESYYGDVREITGTVNLQELIKIKRATWNLFSRYDAGIMPRPGSKKLDVFKGTDINVPGRVNTYILAGLPPVIEDKDSGIRDFLAQYDCSILYKNATDLRRKLNDRDFMGERKERVMEVQHKFTAQSELVKIISFFESVIKQYETR